MYDIYIEEELGGKNVKITEIYNDILRSRHSNQKWRIRT